MIIDLEGGSHQLKGTRTSNHNMKDYRLKQNKMEYRERGRMQNISM